MSYLFQAILLVFVLACAAITEALWSWSSMSCEKSLANSLYKLIGAGGALVIYAEINYWMLDSLMLIPGTIYAIA